MNRIFITGAGVISPIGSSLNEFNEGIANKKKGITKIEEFSEFPLSCGGTVINKNIITRDRKEGLLAKTLEQLLSGHSDFLNFNSCDRLLSIGAGIDYFDIEEYVNSENSTKKNWRQYSKNTFQFSKNIAAQNYIKGGVFVNVAACVASGQAIGLAYRILKQKKEKIIITGGVDSMLNRLHFMGFYKLGALTTWSGLASDSCRPFDKERCGIALGEGCALFTLQNEKTVKCAEILAEICGYSSTVDAYSITDPDPEGLSIAAAAINAINEAGIEPKEIDSVHLHGTGTIKNDISEANALKKIFGQRYLEIPVFSLKGQTGHLISACSAVEIAAVLYSLKYQKTPVTVNCDNIDDSLNLRVIQKNELAMPIKYILKLNAAFGGQNTAFVVKYAK